jgi:hypothetical protein
MPLNDQLAAMSEKQPWKFFAFQELNFQFFELNFQFFEGNFKMSEPCAMKSPLFLSILVWTLAPQEISTEQWQLELEKWQQCKSMQERQYYFFETFIKEMLTREVKSQHYSKGKDSELTP